MQQFLNKLHCSFLLFCRWQIAVVLFLWEWRVAIFQTAHYQHRHSTARITRRSCLASTKSPAKVTPEPGARKLMTLISGCRFLLDEKLQSPKWQLRGGMILTLEWWATVYPTAWMELTGPPTDFLMDTLRYKPLILIIFHHGFYCLDQFSKE